MKTPALALIFAAVACTASAATTQTDIEYGRAGGETLLLDAHIPDGPGPFSAVILVHGGGWTGGDKSGGTSKGYMAPLHEPLTEAGIAWFSINYRLAPQHIFPAPVEDVETAIRWVKAHAAEYRIDPKRIALSGESAGAHLVVAAVVRADEATRVAAVVPIYGRYDLTQFKPDAAIGGGIAALSGHKIFNAEARALLEKASPLQQVKSGLPPFLLLHGTADASVPFQQSVMLLEKLRAAKVPAEMIPIEGGVHGMLGWPAIAPEFKQKIVAWLNRTMPASPNITSASARR